LQKLVAILLIFSFLFGDAAHVNSLRLGGVVHHYRVHKRMDPGMNVLAFFKMHYLDQHGNLSQHKDHGKLPFKSPAPVKGFALLCYLAPESMVILQNISHARLNNYSIEYLSFIQNGFLHSPFHPPSLT
jgi:hypothetical protein